MPVKSLEKTGLSENIRNTIGLLTGDKNSCYFLREYRNLRGESQTGGDAHREREQLRPRGRFTGKWFAEGKGKRDLPGVSGPWARVKGRVCVGTLVRVNRFPVQMKVAPWIDHPSFTEDGFLCAGLPFTRPGWQPGPTENYFAKPRRGRKEGFPWQRREYSGTKRPKVFPSRT